MSDKSSNAPVSACISCESNLLFPTESLRVGSQWEVDLRCPECGWRGAVRYTDAQLEELDRELDLAASVMQQQLSRLEAVHMEEWAALFLRALERDLIGPDDF